MKKALITGATGYIGFNLLQKILKRGWNVAIIKRASSNISNIKNITSQVQMKVLLTGATGFLGSHILKGLVEQNIETVALKRSFSNISSSFNRLGVK